MGWTINWNGIDQEPLDFTLAYLGRKPEPWHVEVELIEDAEHPNGDPFVTGYLTTSTSDDGSLTVTIDVADEHGDPSGETVTFPAAHVLSLDVT